MEVQGPCIYRVPSRIRDVKPEAYTPRMVVIGPLHRYPKSTTIDGAETSSHPWDIKKEYSMMEATKKVCLESFTTRVGEDVIVEMRKIIQAEETNIRASYEESTEWIPSEYFVDLILHDSVFIMEFFQRGKLIRYSYQVGIVDQDSVVRNDLILLENQLPYFIFGRLFNATLMEWESYWTFKDIITNGFGIVTDETTNFKHFTDMFRRVYEESLGDIPVRIERIPWRWPHILELRNADNLSQAGVKFKSLGSIPSTSKSFGVAKYKSSVMSGAFTLCVKFKKGRLVMPSFHANEQSDMVIRNVIAFEQCHVSLTPFTTNYIHFLNFLITSDRDVEVLSEEGVVTNSMGRVSLVVDMVNKLQVGVKVGSHSQYCYIAKELKAHYKSRRNRCWATLSKIYFSDLWTGTATVAAVLLLFMTLVGTVASVIQAYKSFK